MGHDSDHYREEDSKPLMDADEDILSDPDAEWIRHYYSDDSDDSGGKRKREEGEKKITEKRRKEEKGEREFKMRNPDEMWDTIASGNSKDDQEGFRNVDDDNFIDDGDVDPDDSNVDTDDSDLDTDDSDVDTDDSDFDTDDSDMDSEDSDGSGDEDSPIYAPKDDQEDIRTVDEYNFIDDSDVDPDDSYGSGSEHSPISAPQAEEDEEMKELFEMGKNKKTNEKSAAEMALLVENIMAELKVVSEEDAELHRQGKSAVNKLEKLSLLTDVLSKKHLHQEFLDHGGLTLLKNWLEPLSDGNLPDINIRAAVLKILNDFPIDLQQSDRRGLLKRSGLGKVIMFLSMSAEETIANQKLAKELVDKWMNN